jgi:hypothetical protein
MSYRVVYHDTTTTATSSPAHPVRTILRARHRRRFTLVDGEYYQS